MNDVAAKPLVPLHFPLRNSHLIEASAGTGKTYTIAALYLRLVLGHDAADPGQQHAGARMRSPREILVVTFTEAATEELRDRIRARLTEAAAYFRGELTAVDSFLRELRSEYPEAAWPLQARVLDLAAQQMDEAAVSTIHGWCNSMLSEHAFASGSLFTQTLNADNSELRLQAAQDYWRHFIAATAAHDLASYQLMTATFASPEAIVKRCRELVQTHDGESGPGDLGAIQRYLEAERAFRSEFHNAGLWRQRLAQFRESFVPKLGNKALIDGRKLTAKNLTNWLADFDDWLIELDNEVADVALFPKLTPAAQRRLTTEGVQDAAKVELSTTELAFPALVEEAMQRQQQLPDPTPELLRHAANWTRSRFRELQQQRAEIGFDDMLTRLRDALRGENGEPLAAALRKQFPIAMIDEFQDTDPVQYEIFDRIYRIAETDEEQGIFLIGDPKQAIYSFRNADIFTYLAARLATRGRHHTLAVNFRSTHAMVGAVNALFAQAEQAPRGAFLFKAEDENPLPFIPVAANGLGSDFVCQEQVQPALEFDLVPSTGSTKANNPELDAALANGFAERIVSLLNDPTAGFHHRESGAFEALQPQHIAILVSNGFEARLIRDALRRRAVGSVYLSERDSVFGGKLALDVYSLLGACANPRDPSRLRGVFACELLGLDLAELANITDQELRWDSFAEQFASYHDAWQRHGVLAMLQQLLHDFEVPARLLAQANGERQLTDVLHLAELLQQQAQQVEGNHGLLRFLAEHIEQAQSDNNRASSAEMQLRLESDAELIQVVTIHKSKGLQYPLVFLPFASRARQDAPAYPHRYHDAEGKLRVALDGEDAEVVERIKAENFAEELRKLYVAVTRAQYATFIGLADYKTRGNSAINYLFEHGAGGEGGKQALPELSDFTLPDVSRTADLTEFQTLSQFQSEQASPAEVHVCRMPATHRFEPWWVASYSALRYGEWVTSDDAEGSNVVEAMHEDQTEVVEQPVADSIHSFPRGATPGTFLHNLLEDAANEGFAKVVADPERFGPWVAERTQLAPWHEHENLLKGWLHEYLHTDFVLGDTEQTCCRLVDLTSYQAEPEFWFPAHQVDAERLDALVRGYVLPEHGRPRVLATTLNGMLKGFIDLVFEWQGKYYVADYKSNYLGANDSAYLPAAMRDKILESRYDMQFVIYTLALHKLLQARLADYDYDRHVGGALYLFLRGHQAPSAGAFFHRPERALIEELEQLFEHPEALCS
ncbi:exodeoxyribonuclease V subunit beta [Pseudidiomarina sp. 1ASP75-14]|uniref:exodeoxyribonuclease V subunit beta n=1 Tax=Pseudidiomarina terrestris TaxID=2820060 RepID=UPI0026540906|nr:exodeoxyribonuclease V subunit beta [Pseudidiomarina sp. 1ASP75-14]MDN7138191.1 exodeoxyribonuclease V subunit beta [Pseudidiomarina sp. 1ASP75-14]